MKKNIKKGIRTALMCALLLIGVCTGTQKTVLALESTGTLTIEVPQDCPVWQVSVSLYPIALGQESGTQAYKALSPYETLQDCLSLESLNASDTHQILLKSVLFYIETNEVQASQTLCLAPGSKGTFDSLPKGLYLVYVKSLQEECEMASFLTAIPQNQNWNVEAVEKWKLSYESEIVEPGDDNEIIDPDDENEIVVPDEENKTESPGQDPEPDTQTPAKDPESSGLKEEVSEKIPEPSGKVNTAASAYGLWYLWMLALCALVLGYSLMAGVLKKTHSGKEGSRNV